MSTLSAYLTLAVFPVFATQLPNPVAINWLYKHNDAPMPAEVIRRVQKTGRPLLLLAHTLVAFSSYIIFSHSSASLWRVGLTLENWGANLALGTICGFAWIGFQGIIVKALPPLLKGLAEHPSQKGSLSFWIFLYLIGAFSEEFWRALSLFAFADSGYTVASSLLLTSAATGVAHYPLRFGAVMTAMFGFAEALLFLYTGSLITTYLVHLISNLGGLYWIRSVGREKTSPVS